MSNDRSFRQTDTIDIAIHPQLKTMQSALQIVTKVLPGNRIEVQIPSGAEGQDVTVFVVLPTDLSAVAPNQNSLLIQMAQDQEIQSELAAIDSEFRATQMDGLNI
jgi:hypothetical protein